MHPTVNYALNDQIKKGKVVQLNTNSDPQMKRDRCKVRANSKSLDVVLTTNLGDFEYFYLLSSFFILCRHPEIFCVLIPVFISYSWAVSSISSASSQASTPVFMISISLKRVFALEPFFRTLFICSRTQRFRFFSIFGNVFPFLADEDKLEMLFLPKIVLTFPPQLIKN